VKECRQGGRGGGVFGGKSRNWLQESVAHSLLFPLPGLGDLKLGASVREECASVGMKREARGGFFSEREAARGV
jgi:hypothetical protein